MSRLLTRQFKPDPLLEGLGPTLADPAADVAGFHLYTFNEVARTERWRREALERLGARPGGAEVLDVVGVVGEGLGVA